MLEALSLGDTPTSNQIKFGLARCECGSEFTKRRHGQKFCSVTCGDLARAKRAGRVSQDPRHSARREGRRSRVNPESYPYTGKPCNHSNSDNEINALQEAFSESRVAFATAPASSTASVSYPIDLIGGRRRESDILTGAMKAVIEIELASISVWGGADVR